MDHRREITEKLTSLCTERFGGDAGSMYLHYATVDGISLTGLMLVLLDAGVGNRLTRRAWANAILEAADKDENGLLTEDELRAAI